MDNAVIAAIARWPNVPHVYGWLSLDRRGKWRLQGSPIDNAQVNGFIGRNYECDARGAWFFQNGPQRVYVQLDYTPWILRIGNQQELATHTGKAVDDIRSALIDENGDLLVAFGNTVGLIEDRDLPAMINAMVDDKGNSLDDDALAALMQGTKSAAWLQLKAARIAISTIFSSEVAGRYGFLPDPQADSE